VVVLVLVLLLLLCRTPCYHLLVWPLAGATIKGTTQRVAAEGPAQSSII
jgi:hypothetical protein